MTGGPRVQNTEVEQKIYKGGTYESKEANESWEKN